MYFIFDEKKNLYNLYFVYPQCNRVTNDYRLIFFDKKHQDIFTDFRFHGEEVFNLPFKEILEALLKLDKLSYSIYFAESSCFFLGLKHVSFTQLNFPKRRKHIAYLLKIVKEFTYINSNETHFW